MCHWTSSTCLLPAFRIPAPGLPALELPAPGLPAPGFLHLASLHIFTSCCMLYAGSGGQHSGGDVAVQQDGDAIQWPDHDLRTGTGRAQMCKMSDSNQETHQIGAALGIVLPSAPACRCRSAPPSIVAYLETVQGIGYNLGSLMFLVNAMQSVPCSVLSHHGSPNHDEHRPLNALPKSSFFPSSMSHPLHQTDEFFKW